MLVNLAVGESEYIEGIGRVPEWVRKTLPGLLRVTSLEDIRGVQGSNVYWHRSKGKDSKQDQMNKASATARYLRKFIKYVRPRILLIIGTDAYRAFLAAHPARVTTTNDTLDWMQGRNCTLAYRQETMQFPWFSDPLDLFVIRQPRAFNSMGPDGRAEVLRRLRAGFSRLLSS